MQTAQIAQTVQYTRAKCTVSRFSVSFYQKPENSLEIDSRRTNQFRSNQHHRHFFSPPIGKKCTRTRLEVEIMIAYRVALSRFSARFTLPLSLAATAISPSRYASMTLHRGVLSRALNSPTAGYFCHSNCLLTLKISQVVLIGEFEFAIFHSPSVLICEIVKFTSRSAHGRLCNSLFIGRFVRFVHLQFFYLYAPVVLMDHFVTCCSTADLSMSLIGEFIPYHSPLVLIGEFIHSLLPALAHWQISRVMLISDVVSFYPDHMYISPRLLPIDTHPFRADGMEFFFLNFQLLIAVDDRKAVYSDHSRSMTLLMNAIYTRYQPDNTS